MTVQVGDIWEYSRPGYGTATLLVLEYVDDLNYHLCLKLEDGEVGDWLMDLNDQFEKINWRWLA